MLRIIGGQWRGRRVPVPDITDLRPTGARIRETLFNWLMPVIRGARCLDLCAGSGILSLEALSRGAAHCTAVEQSALAVQGIKQMGQLLAIKDNLEVIQADVLGFLPQCRMKYDVVFFDPPYQAALHQPVLAALAPVLNAGAYVYTESDQTLAADMLTDWQIWRHKGAGQVHYYLLQCDKGA